MEDLIIDPSIRSLLEIKYIHRQYDNISMCASEFFFPFLTILIENNS